MMHVHHIASGSDGNAILVDDSHSKLLLDAGLTYPKLVAGLREYDARPSELEAVFISHHHQDHCKAVPDLVRRGIPCYMSALEAEAAGFEGTISIEPVRQVELEGWIWVPFLVEHDTPEPLGLLAQSTKTGERLVYIVDSSIVRWDFKRVNYWLVECNHDAELLAAGNYPEVAKRRIRKNHFSLDNLRRFLETSDLSKTEEIHLLHLSDAHSDAALFTTELQKQTGVPVYAH